jgi:hypothetical protein
LVRVQPAWVPELEEKAVVYEPHPTVGRQVQVCDGKQDAAQAPGASLIPERKGPDFMRPHRRPLEQSTGPAPNRRQGTPRRRGTPNPFISRGFLVSVTPRPLPT